MANSTRVTLTNDTWTKLSDGNKTVKFQVLTSNALVYLTDSSDDPDSTADKDSFIIDSDHSGYQEISTALKVYAKKADKNNVLCTAIYLTE